METIEITEAMLGAGAAVILEQTDWLETTARRIAFEVFLSMLAARHADAQEC